MEQIKFRNARMESGQLIIDIPPDQRGNVMKFLRTKKDKTYSLSIKEYRNKRSLDANAYCWVMIGKLAEVMRIPPAEVYRQAIQDIGGNYEIIPVRETVAEKFKETWESQGLGWPANDLGKSKIPGYRNLQVFYGSSTFDTRQMAAFTENILQDCRALDIPTIPKEELDSLLRSYDEKKH